MLNTHGYQHEELRTCGKKPVSLEDDPAMFYLPRVTAVEPFKVRRIIDGGVLVPNYRDVARFSLAQQLLPEWLL